MIKTPTTKKLSKRVQYAAVDYQPIDSDEVFYKIPKYNDIYVSQYAQIIQTFKNGKAIVRKTFFIPSSGYTTITLTNAWGKRKNWGVHHLVGKVWLEKPPFELDNEPLEVHHHLYKVKGNLKAQPININFACNLTYVYKKYHKTIDYIRSMKIATYNGGWKSAKSIEYISKYYEMPLKDIYDLLIGKPTYKADGLEYYEIPNTNKCIEVRKYKMKKK